MEIQASKIRNQIGPLLDAAEAGEDVVITRNGRPAVRFVKHEAEPAGLQRPEGSLSAWCRTCNRVTEVAHFPPPLPLLCLTCANDPYEADEDQEVQEGGTE